MTNGHLSSINKALQKYLIITAGAIAEFTLVNSLKTRCVGLEV